MNTPIDMKTIIPLVTGGGSGIGLGLVKEFVKYGVPKIIITGRRESVLQAAATLFDSSPTIVVTKVSDAGNARDRQDLLAWIQENHADCNALINNAGIQRPFPPVQDTGTWEERMTEIEINLCGPIHLCTLFIPYFLAKKPTFCMLANVTSGLAFVPFAKAPVYSATKAGLHNYTMALRCSLQGTTNVHVVEIVPPAVKSNLGGSHDFGEECDEYCEATMRRVVAGEQEVGFNFSETGRLANREALDGMMERLAAQVPKYPSAT